MCFDREKVRARARTRIRKEGRKEKEKEQMGEIQEDLDQKNEFCTREFSWVGWLGFVII
jgi:hypothetical protein